METGFTLCVIGMGRKGHRCESGHGTQKRACPPISHGGGVGWGGVGRDAGVAARDAAAFVAL
jgi:hypothetical protein